MLSSFSVRRFQPVDSVQPPQITRCLCVKRAARSYERTGTSLDRRRPPLVSGDLRHGYPPAGSTGQKQPRSPVPREGIESFCAAA